MIFIPYKLDSEKTRVPFFTVLIGIVCVLVYWQQYSEDARHYEAVERFCYEHLERRDIAFLRDVSHSPAGNQCQLIFGSIRDAVDASVRIKELSSQAKPVGIFASKADDLRYTEDRLRELYLQYDAKVPKNLTNTLAYDPNELNIVRMVTSTFSHGSIDHLLGNLLFFYIFAASVELVVGSAVFVGFIAVATLGTSLAYHFVMAGVEGALPTVGLSGVVMAAVAALGVMMPSVRIRCFFWFFLYFKVFRIPALLLALWYIGWDVYEMNRFDRDAYINYVAHVSGAVMGALLGLFYFIFRKDILSNV